MPLLLAIVALLLTGCVMSPDERAPSVFERFIEADEAEPFTLDAFGPPRTIET